MEKKAVIAAETEPTIIGPIVPVPPAPISSGNFKTDAASMIGVAKRKEYRAASSWLSPMSKPPPMVEPVLENPGIRAKHCAQPTLRDCDQDT